jgi:hypothetical protein
MAIPEGTGWQVRIEKPKSTTFVMLKVFLSIKYNVPLVAPTTMVFEVGMATIQEVGLKVKVIKLTIAYMERVTKLIIENDVVLIVKRSLFPVAARSVPSLYICSSENVGPKPRYREVFHSSSSSLRITLMINPDLSPTYSVESLESKTEAVISEFDTCIDAASCYSKNTSTINTYDNIAKICQ